jgi:hypothetical protein
MSVVILGIDIAKQKFDAALLVEGRQSIRPARIRRKVLRLVCAIMRKLVHVIFGVLKSGKSMIPTFN